MNIVIRPYKPGDARTFAEIHYNAVHKLAKSHYPDHIIDDWSASIDDSRIKQIQDSADEEIRIVAEVDGRPAGIGCVIPEKSELRACYVHPDYARRGVGSQIVAALEKIALDSGAEELLLDASLNAKNFYEKNGYASLGKIMHSSRQSGTLIECMRMKKTMKREREFKL
ncbi:MAG TPA: GNAT family N-acetyltransferase [Micavibrio sp.]|nr:GNAT family N-acetyltransferase [Micavibrio sp.]